MRLDLFANYANRSYEKESVGGSKVRGGADRTLMGLRWDATAKTTGYARFGRRYRGSKISGVSDEGYNGWELGVSCLPMPHSLVQLSTSRDYGLESENPASADFTKGTTTRLDWKHDWTQRVVTRASASYGDEEIQRGRDSVTTKDRTIKGFGLGADYDLARWVMISLDYNYTKRDESAKSGQPKSIEDNYSRNVYMLSATFSL